MAGLRPAFSALLVHSGVGGDVGAMDGMGPWIKSTLPGAFSCRVRSTIAIMIPCRSPHTYSVKYQECWDLNQ